MANYFTASAFFTATFDIRKPFMLQDTKGDTVVARGSFMLRDKRGAWNKEAGGNVPVNMWVNVTLFGRQAELIIQQGEGAIVTMSGSFPIPTKTELVEGNDGKYLKVSCDWTPSQMQINRYADVFDEDIPDEF